MNPAAVHYLIRLEGQHVEQVRGALKPVRSNVPPAGEDRLHFASMVLFPPDELNQDAQWLLSIEVCADVLEAQMSELLTSLSEIEAALKSIFSVLHNSKADPQEPELRAWLERNRQPFGTVGRPAQGLAFYGTPGMTVRRIRAEAELAAWVRKEVHGQIAQSPAPADPLSILYKVRAKVFQHVDHKHLLFAEPTQLLEPARSLKGLALTVAFAAWRDHLWWLLVLPMLLLVGLIAMWPWIPHPPAIDLGEVNWPAQAVIAGLALGAMALIEPVRALGRSFLRLPVAALVASLPLVAAHLGLWSAYSSCRSGWCQAFEAVALMGLCSGLASLAFARLSWKTRVLAAALLVLFAVAATAPPGWYSFQFEMTKTSLAQMSWLFTGPVALVSVFLGLISLVGWVAMAILTLLSLAWLLRSSAGGQLGWWPRPLVVVALSMLLSHMVMQKQAVFWLVPLGAALLLVELCALAVVALFAFRSLRDQEEADRPIDREPDADALKSILEKEDPVGFVQNHLAAQSTVKAGWFRLILLKIALWVAAQVTFARSPAGFLDRIGTIHHARWLVVPGTRRLLFLSNYDGSWQSYLEDFIARIRRGLNTIWSNTNGYPRSFRLTDGGASDGSRFKRWARRQQVPSSVWFSGYPTLGCSSIRTNAEIRLGLLASQTKAEASRWLRLLGEQVAPPVVAGSISSLVVDRMADLPFAALVPLKFPDEVSSAQRFVLQQLGQMSYGKSNAQRCATAFALSYRGLQSLSIVERLNLTLPAAFQSGMRDAYRQRKLGDTETGMLWDDNTHDAVMLVYAKTREKLDQRLSDLQQEFNGYGVEAGSREMLSRAANLPERESVANVMDARDGISQPLIRDLHSAGSAGDSQHIVEPGEILLGHPDNQRKPASVFNGRADALRNSSFLVVRQLAFDCQSFDNYVAKESQRILPANTDLSDPVRTDAQRWLAAKMLGRWQDGTSLLAAPDSPMPLVTPDNAFHFGRDDPQGLRCPFGAHIRRMNPRDSFDPGSREQMAITNRHRILRVSRRFGCTQEKPEREGLMFMCLNADLERQFEFLQQSWGLDPNFHGLDNEVDPILSRGTEAGFSIRGGRRSLRLSPLPKFATLLAGGYFLLPGKDFKEELNNLVNGAPE